MRKENIILYSLATVVSFFAWTYVEARKAQIELAGFQPSLQQISRKTESKAIPNLKKKTRQQNTLNENSGLKAIPDTCIHSEDESIIAGFMAKFVAKGVTLDLIRDANGTIKKHIVARGETWESIAQQYNSEKSILLCLNPLEEECLTGMEIEVVEFPKPTYQETNNKFCDRQMAQVMEYEARKNYKEVIERCNEIIQRNPSYIDAYYVRGKTYYRKGKLKQASKDFEYVAINDKGNRFPDAREIHKQVCREWEEKKSKRAEFWVGVGLQALNSGLQIADAVIQSKNRNTSSMINSNMRGLTINASHGVSYSGTNISKSNYFRTSELPAYLDFSRYCTPEAMKVQITYDAAGNPMYSMPGLAKVMNEMNAEMNASIMSSGNVSNSLLAQLTSANSMNNLQTQFLMVPQYPGSSGNDSDISEDSDNFSPNQEDYKTKKRNVLNETIGEKCPACKGTGNCIGCNGTLVTHYWGEPGKCKMCNDTGKCGACNGTGKTSWNL